MALASFPKRSILTDEEKRLLTFFPEGPYKKFSACKDIEYSQHCNVGLDDVEFRNFAGIFSDKIFDIFYQFAKANMKKGLLLII